MTWSDEFEDPIPGIATLRDAANHIQKLPKAAQQLPHWQTAVEALIMAAEGRGPLLHARVGMLRAMQHGTERVFNPDRKETHWGKRKLKRDQ
jgi:hypothetical protein